MDLFTHAHENRMRSEAPLAARMRTLPGQGRYRTTVVGQEDILGPDKRR